MSKNCQNRGYPLGVNVLSKFLVFLIFSCHRRYRLWQKKWEKPKTLKGRFPLEDSSDFDDFWTELILMTRSIIWDALRFFRFFFVVVVVVVVIVVVVVVIVDESILNFKISNFNWPGLGPVRAVPCVRAVPPRWSLKFERKKSNKNFRKCWPGVCFFLHKN